VRPSAFFGKRRLASTFLFVLAGAVCLRLGIWQLDRLAQRRALNATMRDAIAMPTLRLPPTADDAATVEYRKVQAQGSFDYDHQLALRNQALGGAYGYHLVAPLVLAASDVRPRAVAVLVDRGWIPGDGNGDPIAWRRYDVAADVNVEGILRMPQQFEAPTGNISIDASTEAPTSSFVRVIDPRAMGNSLPYELLPYYVQADTGSEPDQLPVGQVPQMDLGEGPHLGYAVQWFGFSLALVVGYGLHVRRQEAGAHEHRP